MNRLQKVCKRLIVATLLWTGADYEQLVGRIYRQGSVFTHVDVRWPFARCSVREAMARDMNGSDDGDVVIVGVVAEAGMESVALGMAVTPTAFAVVATMNVLKTARCTRRPP